MQRFFLETCTECMKPIKGPEEIKDELVFEYTPGCFICRVCLITIMKEVSDNSREESKCSKPSSYIN